MRYMMRGRSADGDEFVEFYPSHMSALTRALEFMGAIEDWMNSDDTAEVILARWNESKGDSAEVVEVPDAPQGEWSNVPPSEPGWYQVTCPKAGHNTWIVEVLENNAGPEPYLWVPLPGGGAGRPENLPWLWGPRIELMEAPKSRCSEKGHDPGQGDYYSRPRCKWCGEIV